MFIGLPIDPIVTIACTHMADKLVMAGKLVKLISTTTHGDHNLDVTNKLTPTHSKALIDYIITDLGIKDLTNNSIVFTPPIKTDH